MYRLPQTLVAFSKMEGATVIGMAPGPLPRLRTPPAPLVGGTNMHLEAGRSSSGKAAVWTGRRSVAGSVDARVVLGHCDAGEGVRARWRSRR